jgi:hypothetical protein
MSVNNTFRPGNLANTGGVKAAAGQDLTVEILAADPALVAGVPRVWVNTTTATLKFTADGVVTKTVTAT